MYVSTKVDILCNDLEVSSQIFSLFHENYVKYFKLVDWFLCQTVQSTLIPQISFLLFWSLLFSYLFLFRIFLLVHKLICINTHLSSLMLMSMQSHIWRRTPRSSHKQIFSLLCQNWRSWQMSTMKKLRNISLNMIQIKMERFRLLHSGEYICVHVGSVKFLLINLTV